MFKLQCRDEYKILNVKNYCLGYCAVDWCTLKVRGGLWSTLVSDGIVRIVHTTTNLKMVTWVAATCRCSLYNKITSYTQSASGGHLNKFLFIDWCTEYITHKTVASYNSLSLHLYVTAIVFVYYPESHAYFVLLRSNYFSAALILRRLKHIAHKTAICRNPPIDKFTGDRRNLTDPNRPTFKHVILFKKINK